MKLPRSDAIGVDGVAGTLEAFLRMLPLVIVGSSLFNPVSSKISLSTLPEYLNLLPQEKKLPPVTTLGASELEGNLGTYNVETKTLIY